ncbi:2-hydroxyacid dehydrogenase [Massilia sp. S19_KUP03_FR1]|uniref:2-hydroxyacid dehydrogenase n=1 Tax=Massilia sp. S19_KUP03_FR1 TaxID=3025503 RepID=UPI002FCDB539
MNILLYRSDGQTSDWEAAFRAALPDAQVRTWIAGDAACDYAVIWAPPAELVARLQNVKAIFLMGAGVDAILKFGAALPPAPIIRLGDAGMGMQMAEYVTHAVLRYFRRFDDYERQARQGAWQPLPAHDKQDFTVGVLGLGQLGRSVIEALRPFGFPLRGWSRSPKTIAGVDCFDDLDAFLCGTRVLVCLLPLTPETNQLLDHARLSLLARGGVVINVARGAHIDDDALLALIRAGHLAGATLDVFRDEPPAPDHPYWGEPRVTITPHISALTLVPEAVRQIAAKMQALARGETVADMVDRTKGY